MIDQNFKREQMTYGLVSEVSRTRYQTVSRQAR